MNCAVRLIVEWDPTLGKNYTYRFEVEYFLPATEKYSIPFVNDEKADKKFSWSEDVEEAEASGSSDRFFVPDSETEPSTTDVSSDEDSKYSWAADVEEAERNDLDEFFNPDPEKRYEDFNSDTEIKKCYADYYTGWTVNEHDRMRTYPNRAAALPRSRTRRFRRVPSSAKAVKDRRNPVWTRMEKESDSPW